MFYLKIIWYSTHALNTTYEELLTYCSDFKNLFRIKFKKQKFYKHAILFSQTKGNEDKNYLKKRNALILDRF